MTDIIDRLRVYPPLASHDGVVLAYATNFTEAANEIERLRAINAELVRVSAEVVAEREELLAALDAIAEVRHCEDDKASLAEIFRIVGAIAKARGA